MDYVKIITRAWEVIWKHKILWVFGILSGIIGTTYSYSSYFRYDFGKMDFSELPNSELPYSDLFFRVIGWGYENLFLFVTGIVLLSLFFILLTNAAFAFGFSGMVQGNLLDAQGAQKLTIREVVKEIRPYFWRVFGLYLLLGVGGIGVFIGLFGILIALGILTVGIGFICITPLICLMVPLSWFLMLVVNIALIAIIAEDLTIKEGLVRGWKIVTGNIGPILLIGLIIIVISFIFGLIISLPQTIAMAPAYGVMFSPEYFNNPAIFFQKFGEAMPWIFAWAPFLIALRGIFTAYTQSVWVQTYLEVLENGTLEPMDGPEKVNPEPESVERND